MTDDRTNTPEIGSTAIVKPTKTPMTREGKVSLATGRKQRSDIKVTDEEICSALFQGHGLVSTAAKLLSVDHRGLRVRIEKDPERFEPIIKAGREKVVDLAERTLVSMMSCRDAKVRVEAAKFALATIGRRRGYGPKTEVTGADGGDLVIVLRPPTRVE